MSDLLKDVDEAMRAERMAKLWHEHKAALITGIAALILGTSAHTAWNAWTSSQKREQTSALLSALDAKQPLPELEKLAAANEGGALTDMTAAARAIAAKDYQAALKLYNQVANDRKAPAIFRELAIVQKVNLSIDFDGKATVKDLSAAIDPVAGNDKSRWQGQALLTRAVIKARKGNDIKGAITDLEQVTDNQELPASLRERAKALIDTYKLEGQS